MRRISKYLIILLLLASCNKPKINILGDFSDCRELTKPLVIDGIFEDMPYGFVVADSTIAAISSQMGENQLFCVNIPSGKRTSTLKIGRGPGEAFHANSIQIQEDTISVAVDPEETFRYLLQECKKGNLSYVLKYDWKGKPETEYKIGPVDFEKIYVAPDGSKLYALANDEKKCNLYIFDIGKLKI